MLSSHNVPAIGEPAGAEANRTMKWTLSATARQAGLAEGSIPLNPVRAGVDVFQLVASSVMLGGDWSTERSLVFVVQPSWTLSCVPAGSLTLVELESSLTSNVNWLKLLKSTVVPTTVCVSTSRASCRPSFGA